MIRRGKCSVLLLLALWPLVAAADERILHYHSDIQIHANGEMTVTERIRVRAEGNQIRRGIYRDFPTRYKDPMGNHYTVEFRVLGVRRNHQDEAWHTEDRSNGVRLYIGRGDRLLEAGEHEFEIIFNTNRQLGFFREHDELWWNVTGNGWLFPIDQASATINFPFDAGVQDFRLAQFTGAFGSRESGATADIVDSSTLHFNTSRPLGPREGFSVVASWPKGLIAEPSLAQRTRWFLGDNGAALALLLGLALPLCWYYWAWNKVGRDPEKGVVIPRFRPPTGLSPAACRYVQGMSFDSNAFTAAIISLAVKGQLEIEEEDKEFTLRRVQKPEKAELSPGERAVLDTLLPLPASSIKMENENHAEFQATRSALNSELKKEYLGRLFHLNGVYMVPAILMSITAAVIAFFFDGGPAVWVGYLTLTMALHGLFAHLMRAPTQSGRLVMDEIEGFKMYLDTAEQDRLDRMRSPKLTPEVFESFLPFAYALGVQNNWCRRFASELPQQVKEGSAYHPSWYNGRFQGMNALDHLGDDFGSSFSSAISSASSPPGSSSGSGGGGFSGGGGGGGGGGGW
jgi:uncharacterized protein (TIGR04222 family)